MIDIAERGGVLVLTIAHGTVNALDLGLCASYWEHSDVRWSRTARRALSGSQTGPW
jgi:hypothetical protein